MGKFILEQDELARGGFRKVFKAKCFGGDIEKGQYVIKFIVEPDIVNAKKSVNVKDKESVSAEAKNFVTDSSKDQTRKSVQMRCLARYLAQCLVYESPKEFGDSFYYSKCYYSRLKGCDVTVEKFIEGTFQKYTNNNGNFTYEGDNMQLM